MPVIMNTFQLLYDYNGKIFLATLLVSFITVVVGGGGGGAAVFHNHGLQQYVMLM